jgi:hypothetical protein
MAIETVLAAARATAEHMLLHRKPIGSQPGPLRIDLRMREERTL